MLDEDVPIYRILIGRVVQMCGRVVIYWEAELKRRCARHGEAEYVEWLKHGRCVRHGETERLPLIFAEFEKKVKFFFLDVFPSPADWI